MAGKSDTITLESVPDVAIRINRNARARRMSLRVSSLDGRVTLTLPRYVSDKKAVEFANDHSQWIREAVEKQDVPVFVGIGGSIPIGGETFPIVEGPTRAARFSEGCIIAPRQNSQAAVRTLLKTVARARLSERANFYADKVGRDVSRITLRDPRSRWGSCSSEGNLMFSWRLIMAPSEVMEYVVAHEVAHLVEMNHSSAFWALVEDLLPNYQAPRGWLRREGHRLHRYRFEAPQNA